MKASRKSTKTGNVSINKTFLILKKGCVICAEKSGDY